MIKKAQKIVMLLMIAIIMAAIGIPASAETEETPVFVVDVKDCATVEVGITRIMNGAVIDRKSEELLSWLQLTIMDEGQVLFQGRCNALPEPVLDFTKLRIGGERRLNIQVEFLKAAPNNVQGVNMSMVWRIEVRGENGARIESTDKHFYFNPNINPGDKLRYDILLKNSGTYSDIVSSDPDGGSSGGSGSDGSSDPGTDISDPGNPYDGGSRGTTPPGGGTTIDDPGNPLDDGPKTGDLAALASKSVAPVLIVLVIAVIFGTVFILLLPLIRKQSEDKA